MVDHELNELKREFLAEAEEKVREIESILVADLDAASLERLAYLAHQLKGSGGSYGYARISEDSAEIEKAAEEITAGPAGDAESRMRERITTLRAEIEKSVRELAGAA